MLKTNLLGLTYPENIDHADPAVLRMLAEAVDSEVTRMNGDLDVVQYPLFSNGFMSAAKTIYVSATPDLWDYVPISTTTCHTFPSAPSNGSGMGFYSTANFDYRGVWLFGGTVGIGTIGNVNRIVGRMRCSDQTSPVIADATITEYRTEVAKSSAGEERLHMSGMFVIQSSAATVGMDVHIEGTTGQSVSIQNTRTDMWCVRLRSL